MKAMNCSCGALNYEEMNPRCWSCGANLAIKAERRAEEDSCAARGWAAQREADWRRATQSYYDTGSTEDHDEATRLFGLWLITSRGLKPPTGRISCGANND